MIAAAIGLGANLGDRGATLTRALQLIAATPGVDVLAASSLYESAPWGDTDQPAFLNAAAVVETTLKPRDLLQRLRAIEEELGKRVIRKWGPRAIDLDLLAFGDVRSDDDVLRLPHPHIRSRPFVVRPLAECAPAHPAWGPLLALDEAGRAIDGETQRLAPHPPWPCRFDAPVEVTHGTLGEDGTAALGRALGAVARPGDVFALAGPLGAGKSCLARGIARALGINGPVQSPTFTLCREYPIAGGAAFQHWDFYRLEGADDLESTGFPSKVEEPAVIAVEWADLFAGEFPAARTVWLKIDRVGTGDERRVTVRFPPRTARLAIAIAGDRP